MQDNITDNDEDFENMPTKLEPNQQAWLDRTTKHIRDFVHQHGGPDHVYAMARQHQWVIKSEHSIMDGSYALFWRAPQFMALMGELKVGCVNGHTKDISSFEILAAPELTSTNTSAGPFRLVHSVREVLMWWEKEGYCILNMPHPNPEIRAKQLQAV